MDDNADLRPHGGNLAAVLYGLERDDIRRYEMKTFGPHLTSDGSLRLFALVTLLNLPDDMLPDVVLLDEPELACIRRRSA